MKAKQIIYGILILVFQLPILCQVSSSGYKYLDVVKNNKVHRIINQGKKVKVAYFQNRTLRYLKGRLINIYDSVIVIESKVWDSVNYQIESKQNYIYIDSIKIIGKRSLVPGIPLMGGGGALAGMTAGFYVLMINSELLIDGIGYFMLGCITGAGSIATLTAGSILYCCKWKKYDTWRGWKIVPADYEPVK